jgi:diguanylate cyclase (GGDEF)-like protein
MPDTSSPSSSPRQIFLVTLPALFLLVVLTSFYWWHLFSAGENLRRATVENAQLRAQQVNTALSEAVSMLFFNIDEAVQNMAEHYQPNKAGEFNQQVKILTRKFPEDSVMQVAVIGKDGYLEYSNLGMQDKVYLGDREHFTVHQNKPHSGLFISKPLMGKVSKRWTIQFSRRIERNGQFEGVMVLSLSPDYLYHTLVRLTQDTSDVILVLRGTGEIMARNQQMDKAMGTKTTKVSLIDNYAPGQSGSFIAQGALDQVERIYTWHYLIDYPVVVSLGLNMKDLMAPVEKAIKAERFKGVISTLAMWVTALLVVFLTLRTQANIRRRLEFEHAALHDQLTGLKNRTALVSHLQAAIQKAQVEPSRFALLFIDLDGFKLINDQHGHAAGDAVLKAVAGRLKSCARGTDLVTRIGGDEFVIVCHGYHQLDGIQKLVDRLSASLANPIGIDHQKLQIGASIGIAMYPEQGQTAEDLLQASDRAMYYRKSERKAQMASEA